MVTGWQIYKTHSHVYMVMPTWTHIPCRPATAVAQYITRRPSGERPKLRMMMMWRGRQAESHCLLFNSSSQMLNREAGGGKMDGLWIEPDTAQSLGSVCEWECVCHCCSFMTNIEEHWRFLSKFCLCVAGECAFPEAAAVQAC